MRGTRGAVVAVLVLLVLLVTASAAVAHDHQICTPGVGDPVLGAEPFHGDDPSGGAILENPLVDPGQVETWGLHPIHHFLHIGPSAGHRAITVIKLPADCPD